VNPTRNIAVEPIAVFVMLLMMADGTAVEPTWPRPFRPAPSSVSWRTTRHMSIGQAARCTT
jgi:hypothetical protein